LTDETGTLVGFSMITRDRTEQKQVEEAVERHRALLQAIHHAQTRYIAAEDPVRVFEELLESLLTLSASAWGFIAEVIPTAEGRPALTVRALRDGSRREESGTRNPDRHEDTLEATNLDWLYERATAAGTPIIENDVSLDPRRLGVPAGSPPLRAFLGLPLWSSAKDLVGVIGLANRPAGYTEEVVAFLEPMAAACANLIAARKSDQRRREAERDLRRAHHELELRVQERTAELHASAAELARSNSELEQFAYIASHDLQEPLRKVQAFGDLLVTTATTALDDQGRLYVERMQDAARRMQLLINDLLSLAQVTSQAKPFVPVDLAHVAREVVSDLESRLKSTGGHVEIHALPRVEGDPTQMRQLLQNLIGNALKFHRQGVPPLVVIRSQLLDPRAGTAWEHPRDPAAAAGLCELTVADNGIGFEEKYLDRIFAPFQRLHGRGRFEGCGMGLTICRKIVERHGGSITARSALDQGTTFIIVLPQRQNERTRA
jgi:signal transduction histidine kinase